MNRSLGNIVACALVVAGMSVNAMPIGIRTMMHGRAARQSVAARVWTVEFDVNGGTAGESVRAVMNGDAIGELPAATREGYTFVGWFTAAEGGTQVTAETIVTGNIVIHACWTPNGGGNGGGDNTGGNSSTTGDNSGTTGGGTNNGGGNGGRENPVVAPPAVVINDPVYAGTIASNYAKAQVVNGALYKGDALVGTVQVKVGKVDKKGNVKISGTATLLENGKTKKVTAKGVKVELDVTGRVPPVKVAFKAPIGEMSLEMADDGKFTLKNGSYEMAEASVGGDWSKVGAKVRLARTLALPAGTIEELLPDGEPVIPKGGKWSFAKAVSVKYVKDKSTGEFDLVIDDTKGTNHSAMKLTYTPNTGIFKGSFKVYAIQGGKLKKFTVKVIGVVVDGKGQGSAAWPGGASFAVTVE